MRFLKWVSIGLGAIVAACLIGVLVIVWFVDPNRFKPQIENAVRDATGREFALHGDIELGFFPWLALRTGEGHFGNAPGFGTRPMVSWKSLQLGAKFFPLLRGDLTVSRVRLIGLDVLLMRRADGIANWQDLTDATSAPAGGRKRRVTVDGIEIDQGHVSFIDETVPRRVEITGLKLTTDEFAPDEPFTDSEISGTLFVEGLHEKGVPFALAVPRVDLTEDYSKLNVPEYELDFGGFQAEGGVAGTLGEHPDLRGTLETNEFDLRALLASVGVEAPKTTDPKALSKIAFEGTWSFAGGAMAVDPLLMTLDDTRFKGNFARGAGADPLGEFALRGDALDLARYIPPTDPASEPFVLPTAMLKALKFRGVVELEQAKLDDIVMKGVTLRLLLDEKGLRNEAR